MTTQTAARSIAPPPAKAAKPPVRLFLTILHLAGLGIIGTVVSSLFWGLPRSGFVLIFAVGFGLILLVGLVYLLFAIGWVESARVGVLYRVPLLPLRWQPRDRPGFIGWLRSLGRQVIDGRMWRSVAGFAVSALLGALVLRLAWALVWSVTISFAPLTGHRAVIGPFAAQGIDVVWAPLVGILGVVITAAGIIGLALLHRVLSLAIVVRRREAELTERVRVSTVQREGAVRAADLERTRIERDLHDGVQPRLVSVGMTLGLVQQKIDSDPDAAKALIAEAHSSTKAAITELRQLARGIHASVLIDRGLDAALSALAGRSHIPVSLDVRVDPSASPEVVVHRRDAEAAVYFSIAEALTNAAKHSRAGEVRITVRLREGSTLWARIEDNGLGGARVQPGGGLDGIANRILAAGGTFRLDSPQGGPTAVEVNVPCAS